ncbi:hypothetical protein AVEN_188700-1 [Araneus ventricosus]|uniref:Uncharacterized protein n=1 Tax=Araneus ventricosus TaxID=182803 RepID=A0A4Y2D784_ARAVE|nr:hypothetical protein AVEN_188700-1 [Araneus ventricosus]
MSPVFNDALVTSAGVRRHAEQRRPYYCTPPSKVTYRPQKCFMIWDASIAGPLCKPFVATHFVTLIAVRWKNVTGILLFLLHHPGLTFQQDDTWKYMAYLAMNCVQPWRTHLCHLSHLISLP